MLARDCAASIARWAKREPFGQLLDKVVDSYGSADDKTVEIKLKKPFPLLLSAIGKPDSSLPFVMPERLAKTDPSKQVTEMVGSGPYKFVAAEYNTGNRVVYEKNDAYIPRSKPPDSRRRGAWPHQRFGLGTANGGKTQRSDAEPSISPSVLQSDLLKIMVSRAGLETVRRIENT